MELEELLSLIDSMHAFNPVTYQYFHQLLEKRTIILNETITSNIVESVYIPLKEFEEDDSDEPITLILNSLGGSVPDGFFLAQYLRHYSKKLNIIITGYAASMAAVLLCGCNKNPNITRICYPNTYGLIHDGYITLETNEVKTAEDYMEFNKQVDKDIRDFILNNTNIPAELYDSKTRHQWFLSAKEMKELGLVDKIIGDDE